ncbi:hypothetical protein HPP92_012845 [Vanilla planifolia]|uniref:AP5B1 C-terminal domain-containing protein n=1 Tax=Vanilla planifolia TaxID=51239 RepID=A0A835UU98_VANPL|nr:hypothetical protein HPP92_012845 [Vanilla planifolia]
MLWTICQLYMQQQLTSSLQQSMDPFLLVTFPFYSVNLQILVLILSPVGCDIQEDSSFRASLVIELEPREPMPGIIDTELKANIEKGRIISGSLQSITVGIEDMFLKAILPPHVADDHVPQYYLDLFHALWEACGSSANIGRETFLLDGGKGAAAIYGTRSVKLLDVSPRLVITSVEQYLAPYVVSVVGEQLVNIIRSNGVIRDIVYEYDSTIFSGTETSNALVPYSEKVPLQLEYFQDEGSLIKSREAGKRKLGTFLILIFLPPRFHLLLQMEVGDFSLVRIRTDHWPCLAYIDEYLESLVK